MKKLTALVFAALVCGLCASVWGTVLHVPDEYPTIQSGIDAATEGDTVLVADGIYTGDGNRDLDFGGLNMVVMSENGPEVTIIDCEGTVQDPHRGFYFHSGEDPTSVVKGFTIRNGFTDDKGGAISCFSSGPTIVGNIISASMAGSGAAIYCDLGSSPTIIGNTLTDNMISSILPGAIIHCRGLSRVEGNTISGNHGGSGIACVVPSIIVGNSISGNEHDGIVCSGSW